MSEKVYDLLAEATGGKSAARPNGRVPLKASRLMFPAEVQFLEKQVSGKVQSVSISLVARTDSVVDTWMGNFVHDLKGMFHKDVVPLDWRHDGDELIGFLDTFQVSNNEIRCSGQVVSVEPGDRAAREIAKARAGIPYEASIFFGGQGIEVEEIPAEKEVIVNGKPFSGPGLVFRKWPMRGVALCPYGKDNDTSVTFKMEAAEKLLPALVSTFIGEKTMSKDKESADAAAETQKALEAKKIALEKKEAEQLAELEREEEKKVAAKIEAAASTAPTSPDGLSGADFIKAFGQNGAVWFAEGKTFTEATLLYTAELESRVNRLEKKLAAIKKDSGGDEALNFGDDDEEEQRTSAFVEKVKRLTIKLGSENLAKFAAGIKLPK